MFWDSTVNVWAKLCYVVEDLWVCGCLLGLFYLYWGGNGWQYLGAVDYL